MTTWYVALHGGANYSADTVAAPMTLTEGRSAWADRESSNGLRRCLDHTTGDSVFFPGWGEGGDTVVGYAWFHPGELRDDGLLDTVDLYPDRILTRGPRGGLRWERC